MHQLNHLLQSNLAWLKLALWLLCLWPLSMLTLAAFGLAGDGLGANPVEVLLHSLGLWGLRLLLITLAITPLRRRLGMPVLTRLRRLLGLFAFTYIALHFVVYAVLDQGLAWAAIVEDILERPYITLGIVALILLIALTVTSTLAARRRLGRAWRRLHQLIYPAAILSVWHFYWQVKLDTLEALIYVAILAALLGERLWAVAQRKSAGRAKSVSA